MTYRKDIDSLKGIAIILVIAYHMGLLKSGYLGVDIFFVVSGFLTIPSVCNALHEGNFRYFSFIERKVVRLLPLIVIASAVCLIVGAWSLLPDTYENLADSVIASNVFCENIHSYLTSKDYWNVNNCFKPLMHLWFVGVLFEFYLTMPLLLMLGRWIAKKCKRLNEDTESRIIAIFLLLSLVAYLLPLEEDRNKFYFLHDRFYELALGGLVGLAWPQRAEQGTTKKALGWLPITLLLVVTFSSVLAICPDTLGVTSVPTGVDPNSLYNGLLMSKSTLLLLTVGLTALVLRQDNTNSRLLNSKVLVAIGQRSYSLFIWHQIIVAFFRIYITIELTWGFFLVTLGLTILLSELTFQLVEQRKYDKLHRRFIITLVGFFIVMGVAFWLNRHSAVIRDVPELNFTKDNIHSGMNAEYTDRIMYGYKVNFPEDNGKVNVLVEGVSFARDFCNCLLESEWADSVNLSYTPWWKTSLVGRIAQADVVICFSASHDVPWYVLDNLKDGAQLWGMGTKYFGESNEQIYRHRHEADYLQRTVPLRKDYKETNDYWAQTWGDHYIDMMTPALDAEGRVRVFTPEGRFISPDGAHLTPEGARWYAKQMDWKKILGF